MRMAACAIALMAVSLTGALAQEENPWADATLAQLLPPNPGAKLCYARSYDAAHLKQHPKQTVTNVTFMMRVVGYDRGGGYVTRNPDHIGYQFAMAVKRRIGKPLRAAGDCSGGTGVQCVVDCDGGGLKVEKLAAGGDLLLRLLERGIRMHGDCDGAGVMVGAKTDDKTFQVGKAPAQVCAALEQQELGQ